MLVVKVVITLRMNYKLYVQFRIKNTFLTATERSLFNVTYIIASIFSLAQLFKKLADQLPVHCLK